MLTYALTLTLSLAAAASADAGPGERDRVHTFLNEQAQAWNRGDLDAFCAVYVDDAMFISPSGVTTGRAQVLARYKKRYPTKAAMGSLSFQFVDTRVQGDVVSVAAVWTLSYPDMPPSSGHTLVVLHRRGSSWAIVQDASM